MCSDVRTVEVGRDAPDPRRSDRSRSSSLQISKCPHCAAMFSTLQNVKKNYGERVRVVFRQYPLAHIRPNARKAAKASRLPHKLPITARRESGRLR